jgi:AcrR family transcriptional regulator
VPAATRDRLLAAAWECVRNGGPGGATSRAITAAAGANLGAITYHFGSKDALLAEAVGAAIEALIVPALDALRDEHLDPAARLLEAVARLQRAYGETSDDAPVYLEVLLDSRRHPELRAHVAEVFGRIRAELTGVINGLQEGNALPDWIAPAPMAGLLLAVAQGVVLQTTIDGDGPDPAAMADQFARLLLVSRAAR